jgi:hypothetical protein
MSEEKATYDTGEQPQHGDKSTCKTCGYEIRYSQFSGWSHVEGIEPAGYFGPDGFWVICGKPEPAEAITPKGLAGVTSEVMEFNRQFEDEQPGRLAVFHVEKSGRNLTEGGFPFCVVTETGDVRSIFCTEPEAGVFADAMNKQPSELEEMIIQVIHFPDGSRLTVKVEAPEGANGDLASLAYNYHVLAALERIEALRPRY